MSFDRYRTFLTAARCRTFFEAAEELYITPATVSKHIAALERELDTVLFERRPHGVALTAAGEEKLPLVQKLVESYDALVGTPAPAGDRELTVFVSPPPSRFGLERILRGFAASGTDVRLQLQEKKGVTAAVLQGECELGFTGGGRLDPRQMQYIRIQRARLGAVLPADHPLAGRDSISLHELSGDRFVLPNPELGSLPEYVEHCRRCGFEPEVSCYGYRDDSILFYVSCGKGVALLTREMFDLFNYDRTVFVPLQEACYVDGYLARSRGHVLSSAAQTFWNYVKKNHSVS
ncbi:MAG: LysR family transcriptional regulator [Oscillospiraceae bacterium]